MKLINDIRAAAMKKNKSVVLPEALDERIIEGACVLAAEKIARPVLVGDAVKIHKTAEKLGLNTEDVDIVNPETAPEKAEFVSAYYEKRKHKGMTMDQAEETMKDPVFWGAMMVEKGLADGCLAGATHSTGHVMRAALQIIGTAPGIKTVSSDILMITSDEKKIWSFADCAVLPDPTADQLADIAIATAETHKKIVGEEPKVAMLSFSTKGSAKHPLAEKVVQATAIVKSRRPELLIDGELQADAAIVDSVGSRKAPGSQVAGQANVLVFPGLEAANIGYKLVQRIAGCEAVGPIIQGLAKPMNDLSRGCSVDDIVSVSAILCNLA